MATIETVNKTKNPLKKAKKKNAKTRNIQPFGSTPPSQLISQEFVIQSLKPPNIIKSYTPETLAATINEYFADPENQPYNLASFQYHLGMNDGVKWDYLLSDEVDSEIKPLVRLIRKGIKYIESELVMLLLARSQVAGVIFYLKAKFKYIEREIHEQITSQAIDIRFTVETEQEKITRQAREDEELKRLVAP